MSKNGVVASKRLNKYLTAVENSLFKLDIIRCRAVYGDADTACSALHSHSYYEIHLCLSGQNSFQIDGKVTTLKKGEFFLLMPKTEHIVYSYEKDYSEFVVAFDFPGESEVKEYLKADGVASHHGTATAFMMSSVDSLLNCAIEEKYGCSEFLSSLASCFFIDLFALVAKRLEKASTDENTKYIDDRISLVKKYIKDNVDKKILIDDIANHINVSSRHLNRIVKESENMNVTELIQSIRIKRAKKLLTTTTMSLSEIAEATGFYDSYHLGKIFKKFENVTPGFHRKDVHK